MMPTEMLDESEETSEGVELKPLQPKNLGLYAPFEVSPEDMYGPDELGADAVSALKAMVDGSAPGFHILFISDRMMLWLEK